MHFFGQSNSCCLPFTGSQNHSGALPKSQCLDKCVRVCVHCLYECVYVHSLQFFCIRVCLCDLSLVCVCVYISMCMHKVKLSASILFE